MADPLRGMDKDSAKLLRAARKRGWTIRRSKRGHPRATWVDGTTVVVALTPSDHRAVHNLRASMNRIERGESG